MQLQRHSGPKGASPMSEERNHSLAIKNIALATDFSPWSDRAMQHALVIARWYGAALHILHAVRQSEFPLVPDLMVQLDELAVRDCEDLMGRLRAARSLDNIQHRLWNLSGEVSAFGDFVQDQKVDLLVLGTRGRTGISKLLLGSVAEQIFHCVSCPVLTVGPSSRGAASQLALKKVLFATDLSPRSTAALPYVLAAAKGWRAAIDVLHVCAPDHSDSEHRMEAYRRRIDALTAGEPRFSIRYHVVAGEPSAAVLDFAGQNNEDLIVLGLDNHRSLYDGPPLSHAYEIVRQAPCPVLSVPSAPASPLGQ
jgi:nucleotide-binding universal stress UspA family protein